MIEKKESTVNTFVVLALVATTFLPSTMSFHILRLGLVGFIFLVKRGTVDRIFGIWIMNIFLAALSVLLIEHSILTSKLIHEFTRVAFYALVVGVCRQTRVSLKTIYKVCVIVLAVHFAIQYTQFTGENTFNSFIINHYLAGDAGNIHFLQAVSSDYAFRSGSIFINPNVYVCYPSLCAGVFLEYNKVHDSLLSVIMTCVAFLSVVLTGSRMGLVTIVIIIAWYVLKNRRRGITKGKIVIFALVIIVLANWGIISPYINEFRAFELEEAYDGSLGIKMSGIFAYFAISNPLYWITGSLGSPKCTFAIDMEFGYIFAWFGTVGVCWYYKLLKNIYSNKIWVYSTIATACILTILLTDIAASTILNMSVFPFICVITLTEVVDIDTIEME